MGEGVVEVGRGMGQGSDEGEEGRVGHVGGLRGEDELREVVDLAVHVGGEEDAQDGACGTKEVVSGEGRGGREDALQEMPCEVGVVGVAQNGFRQLGRRRLLHFFFSFGFSRLEFEVELSGATTYGDGHGHGDDVGGSQL